MIKHSVFYPTYTNCGQSSLPPKKVSRISLFSSRWRGILYRRAALNQKFSTVKMPKGYLSDFCILLILLYRSHKNEGD